MLKDDITALPQYTRLTNPTRSPFCESADCVAELQPFHFTKIPEVAIKSLDSPKELHAMPCIPTLFTSLHIIFDTMKLVCASSNFNVANLFFSFSFSPFSHYNSTKNRPQTGKL